jgi:hypothetical protein
MRRLLVLAVLLIVACGPTGAQPRTLTQADVDSMTQEQVDALPIEQYWPLQTDAPTGELFRETRLALATLYYAVDMRDPTSRLNDSDRRSIVEFQSRLGAERTDGHLTVGQFATLSRYARLKDMQRLSPGLAGPAQDFGRWAYAEGSWVMDDIAFPLNFVRIRCDRQDEACVMTTVDVAAPDFRVRALPTSDYQLFLDTTTFYVDRWSDGIIEARSSGALNPCRETRLVINSRTNRVFQSTQDLDPRGCEVAGRRLPPLLTPRIATLSDPLEASQAYFDRIGSELRSVYGPLAPPPAE